MDKSLLFYIIVGMGFAHIVTSFVGDIQDRDDKSPKEVGFAQYNMIDSVGDTVLDLTDVDPATQLTVWHKSSMKDDFLDLFPNFIEMKMFVKERLRGKMLIAKITKKLNDTEDKYFSGEVTAEQAKRELGLLK